MLVVWCAWSLDEGWHMWATMRTSSCNVSKLTPISILQLLV